MADLFMVFDVESIGLHGEGFAVGYVVIDGSGAELAHGYRCCHPDQARGDEEGRKWVAANVPLPGPEKMLPVPGAVRTFFWMQWRHWKSKGAMLVADCAWPVEARFLAACIDGQPELRGWEGPYPLVDVASVRLAAGLDPLATVERLPSEMPAHDPLADARQSARLLIEALKMTRFIDALGV
jgi:hypothetical protein